MTLHRETTCWVVTDGKAGMENQCLGLAEALGVAPTIKRVKLRSPWRQVSPFLRHGLSHAYSHEGDAIMPPWPDLLIATGRASVLASLYAKRASRASSSKSTYTVQIQNPVINPARFDLVVIPRHDSLTGSNVMTTRGSLHRITSAFLKSEADRFRAQMEHLPSPRIAVIVGGTNSCYQLTPHEMAQITIKLSTMIKTSGGSLMVTPSRRTGEANVLIMKAGLHDVPAVIWEGQGDNPYYGILGLADAILVTCDSVNLASEACATGKPVHVINLPGGNDKFRRFHQSLRDDGMTRPFCGHIEKWSYAPLNDTQLVAERIESMIMERKN